MNDSSEDKKAMLRQASLSNGLILGIFALISTGLIAITHLITKDKIATEIEAALARRLNDIIPSDQYDNDVYHDCVLLNSDELLGSDRPVKAYRMRNQREDYAVFMTAVAPNGYAGKIRLVLGIFKNGKIAGVRVTDHQETPGLGDKIEIEKSQWISQFNGLSLQSPMPTGWQVKKDGGEFDALTGATITPRAVVKAVYSSLQYFEKNKTLIFHPTKNCDNSK